MFLNLKKRFWGYFDNFQGVIGSILGHFWVENTFFPNWN